MKLETERRIAELQAEKELLGKRDYEKAHKPNTTNERAPKGEKSMTPVYLDIALMLFCFFTVILAPLGLFFACTAILKYSDVRKSRK